MIGDWLWVTVVVGDGSREGGKLLGESICKSKKIV